MHTWGNMLEMCVRIREIKISCSSKKTEGISRLARMIHVEETCTVFYYHKFSCSDGTVSFVQAAVWLNDTWRRPKTGIRAVRLVHYWFLGGCMSMIVNHDKGINLLCKIQSGTKMKQSQTQQTWMKVSSLVLTEFLHLLLAFMPICQGFLWSLLHNFFVY